MAFDPEVHTGPRWRRFFPVAGIIVTVIALAAVYVAFAGVPAPVADLLGLETGATPVTQ